MDILDKNKIYNDIKGIVISSLKYLDKGFIYKVLTDKYGIIDVFSKNKIELIQFSKYIFKIKNARDMFLYIESDMLKFNYFRNKNILIALNFISEIISKTMFEQMDSSEIFEKLEFSLNTIDKDNYLIILLFFVISYLKYSGYYIILDEEYNDFDKFYIEVKEFSIRKYESAIHRPYEFYISGKELNLISNLFRSEFIDINMDFKDINVKRLLGIFTNSICINLEVREFKSFKFIMWLESLWDI